MPHSRAMGSARSAPDWDQGEPTQIWSPGEALAWPDPGTGGSPWTGTGGWDDAEGWTEAGWADIQPVPPGWALGPAGYYTDDGRWVERPAASEPMAHYWDLHDARFHDDRFHDDRFTDDDLSDAYDYGRARFPPPEPEPLPEPVGLHLQERWAAIRDWLMAASGLAETEPGIDRAFRLVEITLSIIYFWFGFLKLFPNVSPAEQLAGRTIEALTLHALAPRTGAFLLGLFEAAVAGLLLLYTGNRWVLRLIFLHLCGTFAPFLLFPGETFGRVPGSLTLAGQYIVKNLVLLAAVWTLLHYHDALPTRPGRRVVGHRSGTR